MSDESDSVARLAEFIPAFRAAADNKTVEPGDLDKFVSTCYDESIVQSFDWPAWADRCGPDVTSAGFITEADIDTLRKLLTVHIRKDRFCEGHLLASSRDGTILRILERMKELNDLAHT